MTLPWDQVSAERKAIGALADPLDDELGLLNVNLAVWMARDNTEADVSVVRAGNQVRDSIDVMLRLLYQLRARMVDERREDQDQADEPGGDHWRDDNYTCAACGARVAVFIGRGGWEHYTGAGTAASPVEIYNAGHEAIFVLGGAQAALEIQEGEQ